MKECLNGHIESVSEFYKHSNKKTKPGQSAYYRPFCKKCHNQNNIRRALEKKRSKYPNSYWDCDGCDSIMSIKSRLCTKCGKEKTKGF